MFPSSSDQSRASRLAASELRAWETTIALRISLQKPLDLANQLPPRTNVNWMEPSDSSIAIQHLNSMASILSNGQQGRTDNATLKRKAEMITSLDDELDPWDLISELQNGLQDRWTTVLNKWHSRVSFGSEHAKDRLKVFNRTFWQQIEDKLEAECARDNRPTGEVYDDRMFYATILKSFITSSGFGSEGGLAGSMRAGDLAALRTYRKKAEVERKASKGRKVRYHVHEKLQHFMFPVTNPTEAAVGVDSDRVLHSLFHRNDQSSVMNKARASKRIRKELEKFQAEAEHDGLSIRVVADDVWHVTFVGAPTTLYEGEEYTLQIRFTEDYPMDSPEVTFLGRAPVHSHIYSNGHICLNILGGDWSPALTVKSIVLSILSMMSSATEKKPPMDNEIYARSGMNKNPKQTHFMYHDDTV